LTAGRAHLSALFLLGTNLVADVDDAAIVDRLRSVDLLVVSDLFMTETARLAHVVLPAASFAEKIGTFTNTERRVQMIQRSVPSPGIARAEWDMLVDLSQYFDRSLSYVSPEEIWDEIRSATPAYHSLAYTNLGENGARPEALRPV